MLVEISIEAFVNFLSSHPGRVAVASVNTEVVVVGVVEKLFCSIESVVLKSSVEVKLVVVELSLGIRMVELA